MKNTFQRMNRRRGFMLSIALTAALAFAAESPPTMGKDEAKQLIGKASTPEDHHRLAAYFTQKAEKMDAEAAEHEDLAKNTRVIRGCTR